jgi:hypothetical protein
MGRHDTDLGAQAQKFSRGHGDGWANADRLAQRRDNEIVKVTEIVKATR